MTAERISVQAGDLTSLDVRDMSGRKLTSFSYTAAVGEQIGIEFYGFQFRDGGPEIVHVQTGVDPVADGIAHYAVAVTRRDARSVALNAQRVWPSQVPPGTRRSVRFDVLIID